MVFISSRRVRRKGKIGVTISIYNQYSKPRKEKHFTLGDITVEKAYIIILQHFKALEKNPKEIRYTLEEE